MNIFDRHEKLAEIVDAVGRLEADGYEFSDAEKSFIWSLFQTHLNDVADYQQCALFDAIPDSTGRTIQ